MSPADIIARAIETQAWAACGPTPRLPAGAGFIYFITCMGSGDYPIKIGWSATPPSSRLGQLQNGNPNLLTVVATLVGTQRDEQRLHLYFADLHIRGEWFRRGDDLIDYIGGLPGQTDVYGTEEFGGAHAMRTETTRNQPSPSSSDVNETSAKGGC